MKNNMTVFGLFMGFIYCQAAAALSCGDRIYSSVTLTRDLDCTGFTRALDVRADNVTINLNGYDISGNAGVGAQIGIVVRGFDNFKLRGNGGVIRGFSNAVTIADSNNSLVEGVVFYNNHFSLILKARWGSVNNGFIYNNDFIFDDVSVFVSNSQWRFEYDISGINIWNNEVYYSRKGINLCRAEDSLILDNLVWGSETYGIQVRKSQSIDVLNNHVYDFEGRGITLDLTSLSRVEGNRVEYGDVGIQLDEAERFVTDTCGNNSRDIRSNALNLISNNTILNNERAVVLGKPWTPTQSTADFNVIEWNKIYHNQLGILFNLNTQQNFARNNTFTGTVNRVEDHGVRNRY